MLDAFFELLMDFFGSFVEMIIAFLTVPLDIFFSFFNSIFG
ncbi:hypothetical protein [Enterococcus sp.]|nr:hypothetical protein [Enterococcus sp.]MDU5336485.1 hypothetical protein [Enterococcus sp.]